MLTYIKETHRTSDFVREELLCAEHLSEFYPTEASRTPHRFDADGYALHVCTVFRADASCTHCGLAPEFRGVSK